eukprot:2461412-Pyramimonas_sp.AAC.1
MRGEGIYPPPRAPRRPLPAPPARLHPPTQLCGRMVAAAHTMSGRTQNSYELVYYILLVFQKSQQGV